MPKTNSWDPGPYGPENPEFSSRVRSAIGSPYLGQVDPSRATRLPFDYAGLLGFYTVPGQSKEDLLSGNKKGRYRAYQDLGIPVEADRVYAGENDATTQTWAHEFRHRADPYATTERKNRLLDAYYAGSRPQWEEAVKFWGEEVGLEGSEAEKDLIENLKLQDMTFFSMPEFSEESKAGRANNLPVYGPKHALIGLLDPERRDAIDKVNAPWKIWAHGLLGQ